MINIGLDATTNYLVIYMIVINAISFVFVAIDKGLSKSNAQRVSEKRIFQLYLLGGWPAGIVSQKMFRHKTKKTSFRSTARLMIILNVIICVAAGYKLAIP